MFQRIRMSEKGKNHMKRPKTHEEARLSCCAACGKGGAQMLVKPATEELIRRNAHPSYNITVQSYSVGLCTSCKRHLYFCKSKGAEPRKEWSAFKLEDITIPRLPSSSTDCQCSMCNAAHYNPIGVKGEQKIIQKPIINVSGGPMVCELQKTVVKKSVGVCDICLQITGCGIQHKCSSKERHTMQMGRSRSAQRQVKYKYKYTKDFICSI